MDSIVKNKVRDLQALCKQFRVKRMYLFGSAATDNMKRTSDIDFLIAFHDSLPMEDYADNYFDLHIMLAELFHRDIDLITEPSLSNPYFIREVERTKELIYAE
jgi:predicted nucleotidyltransferase